MASALNSVEVGVEELTLTVIWSGKEYTVRVCGDDKVGELKRRICEVTNVLPKRQKLLYPRLGSKLNDDTILLSMLEFKPSIKMTMIGTVEDDIIVEPVDAPEVIDDFELGKMKLWTLKIIMSTRKNFGVVSANIRSNFSTLAAKGRSCLFWTLIIRNLIIVLLLKTHLSLCGHVSISMKWVELKMGQLGVLYNPNYKITALLDHLAMISVQSHSGRTLECKPLGLIWDHFPEFYNKKKTPLCLMI